VARANGKNFKGASRKSTGKAGGESKEKRRYPNLIVHALHRGSTQKIDGTLL